MPIFRKIATLGAVCVGLLVLGLQPADARPVLDDTTYRVVCTPSIAWPVGRQVCFSVLR